MNIVLRFLILHTWAVSFWLVLKLPVASWNVGETRASWKIRKATHLGSITHSFIKQFLFPHIELLWVGESGKTDWIQVTKDTGGVHFTIRSTWRTQQCILLRDLNLNLFMIWVNWLIICAVESCISASRRAQPYQNQLFFSDS